MYNRTPSVFRRKSFGASRPACNRGIHSENPTKNSIKCLIGSESQNNSSSLERRNRGRKLGRDGNGRFLARYTISRRKHIGKYVAGIEHPEPGGLNCSVWCDVFKQDFQALIPAAQQRRGYARANSGQRGEESVLHTVSLSARRPTPDGLRRMPSPPDPEAPAWFRTVPLPSRPGRPSSAAHIPARWCTSP